MTSLEAKASARRDEFPLWSERLAAYRRAIEEANAISEDAFTEAAMAFLDVQHAVLEFFVLHSGVRDEWTNPTCDVSGFGQAIARASVKQGDRYELGWYSGEYLLHVHVMRPENLKHVATEFWDTMVEAERYGRFVFQENAGIGPPYPGAPPKPALTQAGRSNIYRLVRQTLILEQWDPDSLCDLGWFDVTWPDSVSWEHLLVNGTHAFQCLHRMNYLLYRVEYQRRRRQRKS